MNDKDIAKKKLSMQHAMKVHDIKMEETQSQLCVIGIVSFVVPCLYMKFHVLFSCLLHNIDPKCSCSFIYAPTLHISNLNKAYTLNINASLQMCKVYFASFYN